MLGVHVDLVTLFAKFALVRMKSSLGRFQNLNDVDDEIAEERATSDSAEKPEATARRRGHRGGVDVGSAKWWRARAEEQEQ